MDKIIKAALLYRKAYWYYQQNETEIVHGCGDRDKEREKLYKEMEEAEFALDEALEEKFGPGWDLMSMESLEKK